MFDDQDGVPFPYLDNPTWVGLDGWAHDAYPDGYPVFRVIRWEQVPCLRDKSILPSYMKRKKYCATPYYQSEDGSSKVCIRPRDVPEWVYLYYRSDHFPIEKWLQ